MDAELLGIRIEKARKRRGLTQEQLAKSVGVSRRSIWRVERGDADSVSFGTVTRVLDMLGMGVELAERDAGGRDPAPEGYAKPCCVVDEWSDLSGPESGGIELPTGVYWQGAGPAAFDVADDAQCAKAYRALLCDGTRRQIARLVNPRRLARLWPALRLPSHVRGAWLSAHGDHLGGVRAHA